MNDGTFSPAAADDAVISRFGQVMTAGLSAAEGESPGTLPAELFFQWCTADGVLEVMQWSRQGLGADPAACLWLAALRWYRLMNQSLPAEAPAPPPRDLDAALAAHRDDVDLSSARSSTLGLSGGYMALPHDPAQPQVVYAPALLRVVPLALVPFVEEETLDEWVRSAMSLTHGHRDLLRAAERLTDLIRRLAVATAGPADAGPAGPGDAGPADKDPADARSDEEDYAPALDAILDSVDADPTTRSILHAQVHQCRHPGTTPDSQPAAESLRGVLRTQLLRPWAEVTAPVP